MADSESDLEIDGLESALDTLCNRHCGDESSPNSKDYCSEFCELVEEYTGQWQVPLPQLKVLRTALCSFTRAAAAFPEDCQHIHYVLSSLALSFFELMLFFSKEEFGEEPLKDILDSYQECHSQLLRHRNVYLQHVKQIIKAGGPWENPVLQGILKEKDLSPKEVEEYLNSEFPVFLELRVRYLQACERIQEAMALAKGCLENRKTGKHLFFHQAYLTCLYKASLHEHLHKEMAEINGRDAVEIICNTERVEKDELLLSLCKAFLTQQLHNGDMYYIWDLVFIWSRLHLRAHPSREGFLAECLQLASSATNVRAVFPFIKLVTTELGADGVQVCVEICARALQLCDMQADNVTQSLVYKTIAFLLPHDLEICRACALLVFCQERSLEAYRTVCLLYMHPDEEPHPHNSPVRTNVRFHILQMLKERLCFDPEFWNLLTLRTHCLELISDNVMKAAVLSEMKEEEEENCDELLVSNCVNDSDEQSLNSCKCTEAASENQRPPEEPTVAGETQKCVAPINNAVPKKRKWQRRLPRRNQSVSDDEIDLGDDPEFKYNLKPTSLGNKPMYSLRRDHTTRENSTSVKLPLNRKREYLSRCVKSQILKRKGRKKRWLQGLPKLEQAQTVKEKKVKVKGKKRGRKPLQKFEVSYPDNEISLTEDESGFEEKTDMDDDLREMPHLDNELAEKESTPKQKNDIEKHTDLICAGSPSNETQEEYPPSNSQAVEGDPELDGPPLDLLDCPIELLHSYSIKSKKPDSEKPQPAESSTSGEVNGDAIEEPQPAVETENSNTKVKVKSKTRDKVRTQKYAHLEYYCNFCRKNYKGLNVLRHALSHLKIRKLRCILCGKIFKQLPFAKKHVRDHIEEMCKPKPQDNKSCTENIPATNGMEGSQGNQSQPQHENQPSISNEETPQQKPAGRSKISSLKREERIIRNLRTLIKKACVLEKKRKNPDAHIFKLVDFKEEQVVIKDGQVILKDLSVMKKEEEKAEEKDKPAGENGYGVDIKYQLCPSMSCDRVFLRISSTLTRHAIRCHINEEEVLEKTFVWTKRKCTFCFRQLQIFQHYKDHMKLHDNPLPHFCYHLECSQRFLTLQELKDHVNTHQPLRPQCPFTDCEKVFSSLQCLHDHEWRHYIPAPTKEELEMGPSKPENRNAEAPWKQRVKVEEIWLQSKKGQKESPDPDNVKDLGDLREINRDQACDVIVPGSTQELSDTSACEPIDDSNTLINGYEDVTKDRKLSDILLSTSRPDPAAAAPRKKKYQKRTRIECDPLNVKDLEDMSTLAEGVQQKLGEPLITEHKTFKPEDPSYATFVKAPFIRPPPSTYMDESLLSMRKRRDIEEVSQKKPLYYSNNYKKKETVSVKEEQVHEAAPEQKTRHRCSKCLSSFSSLDELKKHQALNTCSALFGFDSDDES
ncbi:zinc finger protein 654 [Aulostomus maculatus]